MVTDRVSAEIGDTVIVPSETRRSVGTEYTFGVDIDNTGKIVWPLYAEAVLRSPDGIESSGQYWAENALAPGNSHPFRWRFWPSANAFGCWDLKVRVWMENPNGESTPLIDALKELYPERLDHGLLAESEWRDVLEVRSSAGESASCAGSDKTVSLPSVSPGGTGSVAPTERKANVLLLADTSGSMEGQKLEALKEAIDIFANRMYEIRFQAKGGVDPDPDHVGLVDFDESFSEILAIGPIDPSADGLGRWESAVAALDADGGTALYDSIIRAVDELEEQSAQGQQARSSVLIALTDGVDQDSQGSLNDAIEKLGESSVTLFALALSEPGGTGDYDFSVLEQLANATGGSAYTADTINLSSLYELFSTIFEIGP